MTTMAQEYGPPNPRLLSFSGNPLKNPNQLERQLLPSAASTKREQRRPSQGKWFTVPDAFQKVPGFWRVAGYLTGRTTDSNRNNMRRRMDEQSC